MKLLKLFKILKYFLFDKDNMFPLQILKMEAEEELNLCIRNNIKNTEDLENLIFHINSYMEVDKYERFLENKKRKTDKDLDELMQVHQSLAVERDFIFDLAKNLTIGFKI